MDRLPRQYAAPEAAAAAKQGRINAYCVFDASLDHHFALDSDGRVLYANRAQLALWELPRDQALGKTLDELGYGPEVTGNLQQALRAMQASRQSVGVRMHYPSSRGASRALETVLTPILDEVGNVIEVVGVSRDITERAHRDAALRARDARSMALVKLGDQLRTLTTPAEIAFAAAQILGETLGVSVDAQAVVNLPVMEGGQLVALLYLNNATARSWSPEELSFVREVADRTRIAVERRRSEQAVAADLKDTRLLRDLGARLVSEGDAKVLFDEILAAAIEITRADGGTIQLLDESRQELTFVAIHGLPEALTSQFERVSAESHSPCGVALARRERSFADFDVPASEDPSGDLRVHFEFGFRSGQSTPLVSRSGRRVGMFSTHWRERCRLGERELRFLDLLGRQAADLIERTQAEQALRDSERQLRDADRRKDEFIAMLAHELRNPLVPIRTGVELLKSVSERPALIDTIRPMMERQVGHMVRLIDDLLDVSRITSGKIELQRQHVTLASIVGTAVEANRAAIHAARLHLTVALPEPHLVLNVDPTRFAQVLSNLLQNATKFTGPGGRIGLSARVEPAGRANSFDLLLAVSDSGVGIAPAMLPRVFELFAQADSYAHSGNTGLGIGLALARRLIEMHGGTISAHSEGVGFGSEFVIRLPVSEDLHVGEVARNLQREVPDLRVLVVDDNRDAANVMAMLVETLGGAARTAYGGESGLAAALEWRPAVVLLDIGMPGMDGYEVCRQLRRELGNSVGIVALTGWGNERDKQAALQAGFDAHLTKPADPTRLAEVIMSLGTDPQGPAPKPLTR